MVRFVLRRVHQQVERRRQQVAHRQSVHQQTHAAIEQRAGEFVRALRLAQLRQQRPRPMRQIRLQVAAAEQRLLVDGVEPVKDPLHARGVCDAVHIQHRHRRLRLPADDRLLQLQRWGVQLTPHERGVDAQRLDKGILRSADGFFDRRLRHCAHIRRAHLERDGLALRIEHERDRAVGQIKDRVVHLRARTRRAAVDSALFDPVHGLARGGNVRQAAALRQRAQHVRGHVTRRDYAVEPADGHRQAALEADAHGPCLKIIAVGKYFFQLARRDRHVILRLRARVRPVIGAAVKEVGLHIA